MDLTITIPVMTVLEIIIQSANTETQQACEPVTVGLEKLGIKPQLEIAIAQAQEGVAQQAPSGIVIPMVAKLPITALQGAARLTQKRVTDLAAINSEVNFIKIPG